MVGELTRRCQAALREAKGATLTADEIAVTAKREKNLDMGDRALRQDITRVDALQYFCCQVARRGGWAMPCIRTSCATAPATR